MLLMHLHHFLRSQRWQSEVFSLTWQIKLIAICKICPAECICHWVFNGYRLSVKESILCIPVYSNHYIFKEENNQNKVFTKLSSISAFWSGDFSGNSHALVGAIQRMRHMAAPPPLAQLCSKRLKTSQSLVCCLLYQRVSGNLSESSLGYSKRPSSASMQITFAQWQLFCCYLLWYSTSSSFRDLREAWPESIYIPRSWKRHIGIDCSQLSFSFERLSLWFST